jgi:hypothetical protein
MSGLFNLKEFKMYKKLLVVAALVTAVSGLAGLTSVSAKHTENTNPNKVTICHATNAANNPYVIITVDKSAANSGGHDDHTSHTGPVASSFAVATAYKKSHTAWGDIIPAYDSYAGLNWTIEGQAVYNNHCNYPVTDEETAMLDYDVVCDVVNSRAKITLTNTGNASGTATVNDEEITIDADTEVVAYVSTPSGKTNVTIVIDEVIVYDEDLDCRAGGQGGDKDPETEVPVVTPTTPATPAAGQGAATEPTVASLPYTAGESTQPIALIISAIATVAAVAGTIIKKAYLKQI